MADLPRRFGKFLLLRQVAVGGMAEIFLAIERSPHGGHRFVTIKRIRRDFDRDEEYVEFFLTEGRVSLQCAHPNLPQAYGMGQVDGCHYLALEYIHGHTLLDVARASVISRSPLAVASVVHIGVGVAAALEHAHGLVDVNGRPLRVVHRDVTPQNVMLSVSGAVKLIDFGIVRSTVQTHRTESGVVKGKFSYMAPETLSARNQLDHRSDLFALGIVMHESATGRSLFRGETDHETIARVKSMPIPDLTRLRSDVPPEIARVVNRALERDPDRRYQSATEMLQDLELAAEVAGIHHSMLRLRDDVLRLCGVPPLPQLPPGARTPPPELERPATEEGSPETAAEPPATSARGSRSQRRLERDPHLAYFLRQSGATPSSPGEPSSDAELTELLASLER